MFICFRRKIKAINWCDLFVSVTITNLPAMSPAYQHKLQLWVRMDANFTKSIEIKGGVLDEGGRGTSNEKVVSHWSIWNWKNRFSPEYFFPILLSAASAWTFDFPSHYPNLSLPSAHFLCVTAPFPVSVETHQKDNPTNTQNLVFSLFLFLFLGLHVSFLLLLFLLASCSLAYIHI